jgi:hypothetical protein
MRKFPAYTLCLIMLMCGCRKDQPPEPPVENNVDHGLKGELLVLNEGNFMLANASISKIDLSTGNVFHQYYEQVNQQSLGDVAQSISFFQGKAYLVINNSHKILVADSASLTHEKTINGFVSPRYMAFIHPQKAYVSDLYANAVHIMNPLTGVVTGNIPLHGWTEEICMTGQKVFVGNWSGSATYIINPVNDAIMDSVITGKHSAWLCADDENQVWVLSSGQEQEAPMLSCIDVETQQLKRQEVLPFAKDLCSKLVYDPVGKQLYFLAGDVFAYRIKAKEGERLSRIIRKEQKNFYGLGIHPDKRIIMVSDARNFVQKGAVHLYAIDGGYSSLGNYECGMIPGEMVLR